MIEKDNDLNLINPTDLENAIIILAVKNFESELDHEIRLHGSEILYKKEDLYIVRTVSSKTDWIWARDVWWDLEIVEAESISLLQSRLKTFNSKWVHLSINHHRRGELIAEKLPLVKLKKISFNEDIKFKNVKSFSLLSNNKILVAKQSRCPFPLGEMEFNEDKINPPSRAYLKLWEVTTVYKIGPKIGDITIDVGSCPGGWTWVLQQLGTKVTSVDKAPIEDKILNLPNVTFLKQSAFALNPKDFSHFDWFYSDIICYPSRLYELVKRFIEHKIVSNFVCTLKFQGETDYETLKKFLDFKGSQIIHLHHNKHEVTWIYQTKE